MISSISIRNAVLLCGIGLGVIGLMMVSNKFSCPKDELWNLHAPLRTGLLSLHGSDRQCFNSRPTSAAEIQIWIID